MTTTAAAGLAHPLPGKGLLARSGDLLLVCGEGGDEEVDRLLSLVAEVAAAGGDGSLLVRRVAALLATDFDGRFPACAAAGPTRDGRLAVLVYGAATADVNDGGSGVFLAGVDGITSVNRLVSGPVASVRLQLPGAGPIQPRVHLEAGVVGAAGVVLAAPNGGILALHGDRVPAQPPRQTESGSGQAMQAERLPQAEPPEPPEPPEPSGQAPARLAPSRPRPADDPSRRPRSPVYHPLAGAKLSEASPAQAAPSPPEPSPSVSEAVPAPDAAVEPPPASASPVPTGPASGPPAPASGPPAPASGPPAPASGPPAPASGPPAPGLPAPTGQPAGDHASLRQPDLATPFVSVLLVPGVDGTDVAEPPTPVVDPRPKVLGVLCKNDHFNDPSLRYCAVCGISMAQQTLAYREGHRPPLGVLLFDDGSTFRLDMDYMVGREPQVDPEVRNGAVRPLRITDGDGVVSRRHLRVALVGWEVQVVDLGSANGTYVAGPGDQPRRMLTPNEPMTVRPGTQVTMGRRWFRYESHRNP